MIESYTIMPPCGDPSIVKGMGSMRAWTDLSIEEQTALLDAYGHYLDGLPTTCDMRTKQERLQSWLAGKNIEYLFEIQGPA